MAYKVLDVANKLLNYAENYSCGELLTNMKLQKMLYYQQGFHLAMFGTPLFDEEIEAWMYGPVVPEVYEKYKDYGKNGIQSDKDNLIDFSLEKESCLFMEVYDVYGKFSAIGLMNLTHKEAPWRDTPTGEGNVISKDKMRLFFKKRLKK